MSNCLKLLGWSVALALWPHTAFGTTTAADLILFNGKLFTADPAHPTAEAIAVRGDRILAVGSDAEIKKLADTHTKLIDVQGHTVIPGLNDAHAHLSLVPGNQVDLETESYDPGWTDVKDAVAKAIVKAPTGAFLSGTIGTTIFYDPSIDRTALDKISLDHPLMLGTFDGHALILNSAALERLGIGEDVRDPAGGRYERDAHGRLTGVVREYASDDIAGKLAAATSDADAQTSLRRDLERCAHYGLTTIQDMPVSGNVERTARLLAALPTPIRVRLTRMNSTTVTGPDYSENASAPAHPAPLVAVNGTKWLLDGVVFEGSLTPRTMASRLRDPGGPYSFAGLPPLFASAILDGMLKDSLRNNYQLQVHVFGTPAAKAMLDAMERTGGARVWSARRLRFEHGDGLTPDLAARVKALASSYPNRAAISTYWVSIRRLDPAFWNASVPTTRSPYGRFSPPTFRWR